MTALLRIGIAIAFGQYVAGCATYSSAPSAFVTSPRAKVVAAERAKNAVVIGKSTKADVIGALGETLVISFDTGYEVWVYRLANAPNAEFVILFSASGTVVKTRLRPAPPRA